MATTVFTFIPLIFIAGVIAIVLVAILKSSARSAQLKQVSQYHSSPKHQRYVPGEFSNQMELDIRLPYRRFRQLYPSNRLTYQQYKDLQMRSAFRRSMSSQDNQRMVR